MTGETQYPAGIPEDVLQLMRLEGIFMPFATRQRHNLYANQARSARFVHYTSADAALSIIQSKRIWMRNTTCMSDYREVQHGFEIFKNFFSDESKRKTFVEALDVCVPGAALEAIALFDQWWMDGPSSPRFNTYIASISEHDDKEDLHGRLSMWRGFNNNVARVAIVLKIPYYAGGATRALNTMFSPVAYLTEPQVHDEVRGVIENIRTDSQFLSSIDRSLVVGGVLSMLIYGVACLKHGAFHEEREWRAIYTPKRSPSPLMESSTETIGGVPQIIHKLPLDVTVSDALRDLDLSNLFDRLIIGPSPYPWVMYEAFVAALSKAGITDPGDRVWASNIPIRA